MSNSAAAASAAQLQDVAFGDSRVAVRFAADTAHAAVSAAPCESASESKASVLRELSGCRDAYLTLWRRRNKSSMAIEFLGNSLCGQ